MFNQFLNPKWNFEMKFGIGAEIKSGFHIQLQLLVNLKSYHYGR
jgi:hypothetical protein